ncbi:MAG TPA: hypothetical protein VLV50_05490 [Stellaceae bacterium]|nr:hypothetical protein [Stellaceae bacterium]
MARLKQRALCREVAREMGVDLDLSPRRERHEPHRQAEAPAIERQVRRNFRLNH